MTPFDFITGFFAIVFGLALTHILSGAFNLVHRSQADATRLAYAAFLIVTITLNWWVAYAWRRHQVWTFDVFLLLVLWTISFYGNAITLFPPKETGEGGFETVRRPFLASFLVMLLLDTAATATRTGLFSPWYYLLFVGHYALIAIAALLIRNEVLQRIAAFWFLGSVLTWSLVVRRLVA